MAEDTREAETPPKDDASQTEVRRPRRPKPKHDFPKTQAGKLWEAFGNPEEPINTMPGGTYNSAGGKPQDVTWRDALKFSEFNKEGRPWFYQTSCARDSLLVGMGAGGAAGGLRFILKGLTSMVATTNYAVGSFSIVAGAMYYWCNERRKQEAQGMAAAVAGMKVLNERKARERAAEEAAQAVKLKVEEERKQNQPWYKFW